MNEALTLANSLKEKHLSPLVKRLLNIIFVSSISSLIFKASHFDYYLIDFKDYQSYYFFFMDGTFIVPLTIFFLIWSITYYGGLFLFKMGNLAVTQWWEKDVLAFSLQQALGKAYRIPDGGAYLITKNDLERHEILKRIFRSLLTSLNELDVKKLRRYVAKFHHELEEDFILIFRACICITVFVFTVPYFGGILYALGLVSLLFYIFLLFLMYQLIEIVPVLVGKSIVELEKTLRDFGSTESFEPVVEAEVV